MHVHSVRILGVCICILLVCTHILELADIVLCPECTISLFFHLFMSNMILMLMFFFFAWFAVLLK